MRWGRFDRTIHVSKRKIHHGDTEDTEKGTVV